MKTWLSHFDFDIGFHASILSLNLKCFEMDSLILLNVSAYKLIVL